ncbi:MAG: sensor histidine kinase [Bdellovibrionota bacterium]
MRPNSLFQYVNEEAIQRGHLRRFSLFLLINGGVYIPWGYIQRWADPHAIDPKIERLAVYAVIVCLFLIANFSRLSFENKIRVIITNRWIFLAHYFSLIARNHISINYAFTGFFLVFHLAASFERPRSFLAFAAFALTCSAFCISHDPEMSTAFFRLLIGAALFLSYFVMVARHRLVGDLQTNEQLLRGVFSSATVGLVLMDLDGRIMATNQKLGEMLQLSLDLLEKNLLADFCQDPETLRDLVTRVRSGSLKEAHVELGFRGYDGNTAWGKVSITRITPKGRARSLLAVIEDVTTQRDAELLIRDRQEKMHYSARMAALGEMAGGIAHEINNPLAVIDATAWVIRDSLSKGEATPKMLEESLAAIQKMIWRTSKIISGLRRFSRDGSHDPLHVLPLHQIVQETLLLCEQTFRSHSVELSSQVPEELWIRCRGVEISQVILNVVNNALDAVKEQPVRKVELRALREPGFVRLEISNSGPPIPREIEQKIFQPFFTTKPVGEGVGLGLSISHGMLISQGGSLSLHPDSRRTCFVLRIPEAKAPATEILVQDARTRPILDKAKAAAGNLASG